MPVTTEMLRMKHAVDYLNQVKRESASTLPEVYRRFKEILSSVNAQGNCEFQMVINLLFRCEITRIVWRLSLLFHDRADQCVFTRWLSVSPLWISRYRLCVYTLG